MDKTKNLNPQELQITLPEKIRPGVYANITNISITNNELVMNFIFANSEDTPNGIVVSRVIVSRKHAKQILDTLKAVIDTANEVDPQ